MDQQEYKVGSFDAQRVEIGDCPLGLCVTKVDGWSIFCPCLIRLGSPEKGQKIKVYCDRLEDIHDVSRDLP